MSAFENAPAQAALVRVFTTPLSRFFHVHLPAYSAYTPFPGDPACASDPYAFCRSDNPLDPHYLTDYVTPAAAVRTALAGLDAALRRSPPCNGLRARLRDPQVLAKIRVQMAQPGACAQQAVSLLASALVADPALAAGFSAQVRRAL
jgi:hypothetical protein